MDCLPKKVAVVERWPLVAWRFDCNVLFGNTVIEKKWNLDLTFKIGLSNIIGIWNNQDKEWNYFLKTFIQFFLLSSLSTNITIFFNHIPSNWYWIILLKISSKKKTKWWLVALEKRNQGVEKACKEQQIRLNFLQWYFDQKMYFGNPLTPVSQLTIL